VLLLLGLLRGLRGLDPSNNNLFWPTVLTEESQDLHKKKLLFKNQIKK
jgi:hypothetical protein